MAPLHVVLIIGISKFFALYFSLQILHAQTPLTIHPDAAIGAISMVLFIILLRVYDEIKDIESDLRLAAAGDPRYTDRPIVTGKISEDDLYVFRNTITLLLVLINLALGPQGFAGFLLIMLILWLSSQWFFWPAIKHSLLLAFVTHNPLALAIAIYAVMVFHVSFQVMVDFPWTMVLLVGVWLPAAVWEMSRKIRVPEDETDYDTYSKILGWKIAAIVPVGFAILSMLFLLVFLWHIQTTIIYCIFLVFVVLFFSLMCLRFRFFPSRKHARLQPYSELLVVSVDFGLCIALVAQFGMGSKL